jgi:hypothetical protein
MEVGGPHFVSLKLMDLDKVYIVPNAAPLLEEARLSLLQIRVKSFPVAMHNANINWL